LWLKFAAATRNLIEPLPDDWHDSPEIVRSILSRTLRSLLPGGSAMLYEMLRFCGGPLRKTGVRWADAAVDAVVDRLLFEMLVELLESVREYLKYLAPTDESSITKRDRELMRPEPQAMTTVMPNIRDGKNEWITNPAWSAFLEATSGVEVERLRFCPICYQVYYAWRRDKGACDRHLALARLAATRQAARIQKEPPPPGGEGPRLPEERRAQAGSAPQGETGSRSTDSRTARGGELSR
jgi:hypothetical protein